jgi:hypothetical protein
MGFTLGFFLSPWDNFYEYIALIKWPCAFTCLLLAQTITAAKAVRKNTKFYHPNMFWLQNLFLTFFSGFSGGLLAPLLIGDLPIWFNNDSVIIMNIIVWASLYHLDMGWFYDLDIVKIVTIVCLALFRAHTNIGMTLRANEVISPNIYHIAMWGPIFTATLLGSGGLYFPQRDSSWNVVNKSVPWAIQGSFICSFFTHFMINDIDGTIGTMMRSLFGTMTLNQVKMAMCGMHLIVLSAQTYHNDPSIEIFGIIEHTIEWLFHKGVYDIPSSIMSLSTSVQSTIKTESTTTSTRKKLLGGKYNNMTFFSISIVVLAYLAEQLRHGPHLIAGAEHAYGFDNKPLLSCRILPETFRCNPYALEMDTKNGFASLEIVPKTAKLTAKAKEESTKFWSTKAKIDTKDASNVKLSLEKNGILSIVNNGKTLWKSAKKCKAERNTLYEPLVYMYISEDGVPTVLCGG